MSFLLVYDRAAGQLRHLRIFTDAERDEALRARFELELDHRADPNIEVVVIDASSEEALRQTHRRYFESVEEIAANP